MRASILVGGLAFATSISAQYYANQSEPFQLILQSASNSTLNGAALYACHEGAAIEGLCVGTSGPPTLSNTYNFNYTDQQTPDDVLGYTGLVTWVLHGGNFNASSSLQLNPSPTSNVAVPLFFPGDGGFSSYGFDKEDKLFVAGYLDNSVSPPVYKTQAFYHWYACITNAGYIYQTLAWVVGPGAPENPSCQKVEVKRVFI
ncbi:hypothetical protein BKA61DRAFT_238333 [Leptodontidium sp. MPI-SDFR-AT-0119]|nr:hypothetical protein BKA61DRAFT_238333 [Leptodontidium sp. MPI-SDFR-AT-0119]